MIWIFVVGVVVGIDSVWIIFVVEGVWWSKNNNTNDTNNSINLIFCVSDLSKFLKFLPFVYLFLSSDLLILVEFRFLIGVLNLSVADSMKQNASFEILHFEHWISAMYANRALSG